MNREEIELEVLCALLSNPERYKYISQLVESGELTQEEATKKNIEKSRQIAHQFIVRNLV